jgi:hydrogenase maturation protein HypF
MSQRLKIQVRGIVQGVGFRPFVYNLAKSLDLKGYVLNSSQGVTIEIEGGNSDVFTGRLRSEAPPLSQIMDLDVISLPACGYKDFLIMQSSDEGSFTLISPDVSVCGDCFREMLDEKDRRYLYPFINCTNCGPRYTITKSVPYDRPNTTMSVFPMCAVCDAEYHNPENRRFHAQPNACPVCGPQIRLTVNNEDLKPFEDKDPMEAAIAMLKQGAILAIKGLGGFHLACDAMNRAAVETLRARKRRSNKPFALMSPDVQTIRKFCGVSMDEESVLQSIKRPIVLLDKANNSLPEAVSPNNPCIGFMLPYTPLHYLLFYQQPSVSMARDSALTANFDALVMTSGNISEEPIVIDNEEALAKLSGMADAFLTHNRDIFMRADDSVVRLGTWGKTPALSFVRRSRGYVPDPIQLHEEGPDVLGCGSDIKNTFTLTKGSFAIPSQHIGDMENFETLSFFEESLKNLKSVYRVNPEALACDLHPGYLSTQWALRQEGIAKTGIQHHYAHVASVMAEKGIKERVIGVSFDGTGYGTDGNLWGGEFLITDVLFFKRAGHLRYIPLPGGERAVKEPWRLAVSYLMDIAGDRVDEFLQPLGFPGRFGEINIRNVITLAGNRHFSPLSSGAGRLFDAMSSMIGVCDTNTFEGEAAIALEAVAAEGVTADYPVDIKFREVIEVDFSPAILAIVNDVLKGEHKGIISAKFHNTVIAAIITTVQKLSSLSGINNVVLCGGVFQNMYLLKNVFLNLHAAGMKVHVHDKVPTNDAGISLGQAYILRERIKAGIEL